MYQQPLKFDMTLLLIRENKLAIRYILLFFVTAFFFPLSLRTTSNSIAGKTKPKLLQTETPPEQMIDVENGKALNAQYVLGVRNSVQADITPMTNNKVKVLFKVFSVGPISFKADGERFKGELSVTYLDDDMRISRGDQGNAFVLLRESVERENADRIWKNWKKSWKD